MIVRAFVIIGLFVTASFLGCSGGAASRPPITETPEQKAELDKQHAEIQKTGKYPETDTAAPAAAHQQ